MAYLNPILQTLRGLTLLRITVALLLIAHGLMRLYVNSLHDFGAFLDAKGFPAGYALAWCVTLLDIIGGVLLALGKFRRIICAAFIVELVAGIILVHFSNGWFVVGHQTGGMEYSVLLIVCLAVIASSADKNSVTAK